MSGISEIHADIYTDGKVQLNPAAQSKYKKELIKDIFWRSLFFLLGGAFLIFAGYVSTYSFLASIIPLTFGELYFYLTFSNINTTTISIDKGNVKLLTDDYNKTLLLRTLFDKEGLYATQEEYDEIGKKYFSSNIKSFQVNNKKVLGISTEFRSYSVSEYCRMVSRLLYQETISDLRKTISDFRERMEEEDLEVTLQRRYG